ncbi:hypothetical protein SLEP1_g5625 [Rubroshorea leprosula]|uniref:Uncharacterized protein n=1 Tax=Rubroshorea leprosula TaxID=152421 RepID=A0AAV5I3B6_9ROSI|nr:hypothetical protein SLEP1_g5625 [Rubroshorea leprosula]
MRPSLKNPPQDKGSQGPNLPQTNPSPFVVPSTDYSRQHQSPKQSPTRDHHAPSSYPNQNQQSHHNQQLQLQPAPRRVSSPQRDPSEVDNTQPTDQISNNSQQQSLLLPKDNSQPSSYQSSDDYQHCKPPSPVRQQESPPSSQMYPGSQFNPVTGQPQAVVPVITAFPLESYKLPTPDHVPGNSPPEGYPPQAQPPQPPSPPPQKVCFCCNCF